MIGAGLGFHPARPSAQAAPPPAPAILPVTPTARWHAQFSVVAESGGRVVTASDLHGLADAIEGAAGAGPQARIDGMGRKFWRFEGAEYLTVGSGLVFANTRQSTVFAVARVHRASSTTRLFSGGSAAAGTAGNGAMLLDARTAVSGEAPFVGNARAGGANKARMVVGAQLQVLGNLRRTTGEGGDQTWINRTSCVIGTQGSGTLNVAGAEIGRYAYSPGASGNWGNFDLYELVVYDRSLTPAECQAIAETLADSWAISEIDHQLILEGDSIMQGTGLVTMGLNPAMVLTEPGAGLIPANWRVVNMGVSGARIANLVTRRDTTNGWATQPLAGQNVLAFEIGRNDFPTVTAEAHYAAVVAYLNTPTTGVLQRGWTVRAMANIAGSPGLMPRIETYRGLIRAPQFLIDTQSQVGGPYDGAVGIVDTDLIEDSGNTVFLTGDDAGDTTYYAGDSTHPTILGARLRMTGGDHPARGVAWGLAG